LTGTAAFDLGAIREMEPDKRIEILLAFCEGLDGTAIDGSAREGLVDALTGVVEGPCGTPRQRLFLGEFLGKLGDPRICAPDCPTYWVDVGSEDGTLHIARFPVTNAEYIRYVERGGYEDTAHWSEQGRSWLANCTDPWPVLHRTEPHSHLFVPNQPVVGVSWYEADAYARRHGVRLQRFDERLWVVRGPEKRPYPWGSPFREGDANTREEVLNRPCAVGLYPRDRTPEGVRDLAGNVAEWTLDSVGSQRWIHPGSWDQPSMAAWAKARSLENADLRSASLGFRLARD
jgi:formylglycine-generating enzyme required for sulfatase activity